MRTCSAEKQSTSGHDECNKDDWLVSYDLVNVSEGTQYINAMCCAPGCRSNSNNNNTVQQSCISLPRQRSLMSLSMGTLGTHRGSAA